MKLVYLVSNHNAGSTPIALVANAHPDMVSPGEMVGPGGRFHGALGPVCSCGKEVAVCPFWQEVGIRYRAMGFPWQPDRWGLDFRFPGFPLLSRIALNRPDAFSWRTPLFARLPWFLDRIQEMLDRNAAFAQIILDVSGRKVVLDASKHQMRLYHLSRIKMLDLRVVHLIRDPRGWCNSRRKNFNEPVNQNALRWSEQNISIDQIVSHINKEKRIVLRYEEFCENPQATMARIWALADLPEVPVPEDLNTISHHLLGNRMRTRKNLKISQDLSWQNELSTGERAIIEQITASTAQRFGYSF